MIDRARRYDDLQNEGMKGGYNPYRQSKKASGEPRWSILSGKKSRILLLMEGTSTQDSRYAELESELASVVAEIKANADDCEA